MYSESCLLTLIEGFTTENISRLNHIKMVVSNIKELSNLCDLSSKSYDILLASAYLHDIGYLNTLNKFNFHAYDGYVYLLNKGFDISVCNLVLHHTYSELLDVITSDTKKEVLDCYRSNKLVNLSSEEMYLFKLLSLADMTSDGKGNKVTIAERIEDIRFRYGKDSIVYNHILEVKNFLLCDKSIVDLISKKGAGLC